MFKQIKRTEYVDIVTTRGGNEKHYYFKSPDGNIESSSKKAMAIILGDLAETGRNPKDYNFLVGENEDHLTMRAVYSLSS